MKVIRRILAAFTLFVSAAMLLLSIAGGVGVWIVKGPATAKATTTFGRVEGALDVAEKNLDQVKASIARASDRLSSAREDQAKLAQDQQNSLLRRTLVRTVQRSIAPELGDANEKLHTVAEAAVVVNSILEDAGNFQFLAVSGFDTDSLTDMNSQLARVGPAAWELSRLLGGPDPDSNAAAADQLSRIERTLETLKQWLKEFETRLKEVRQRTETLKSQTLPWITPGAILISVVCGWIALSQVSLMCHAWSWWKR